MMKNENATPEPNGQMLIYQTEDGRLEEQAVRISDRFVWGQLTRITC